LIDESYPTINQLNAGLPFLDIEVQITFKLLMAKDQAEVVSLINQKVDLIKSDIEKDSRNYIKMNEDQISSFISSGLRRSGMDADHDSSRSGHVDIIVKHRQTGFEWYAEAKIWNGVEYLNGGFDQLFTRYCSNNPNWEHGAILVYCKNMETTVSTAMSKWKDKLNNSTIVDCPLDAKSSFISSHEKVATGTPYHIRHTFMSLHYDPSK
jgi:hypothetical protein